MKLKIKSTRLHISLAAFWALMLIPTILFWRDSILWVLGLSLYALVVGHIASYEAANSAGVDAETHAKLDAISQGLADLMELLRGDELRKDVEELKRVVGIETED